MLNEQLSENEALVQLDIARAKIIELEEKLLELWQIYQDSKNRDYYTCKRPKDVLSITIPFDNNEQFARIAIKRDGKIIRVEASPSKIK